MFGFVCCNLQAALLCFLFDLDANRRERLERCFGRAELAKGTSFGVSSSFDVSDSHFPRRLRDRRVQSRPDSLC